MPLEQHDLTCAVDDMLVIGGDLQVTVLEIHDDHVRLALSCPHSIPSYREEVLHLQSVEEPYELQMQ